LQCDRVLNNPPLKTAMKGKFRKEACSIKVRSASTGEVVKATKLMNQLSECEEDGGISFDGQTEFAWIIESWRSKGARLNFSKGKEIQVMMSRSQLNLRAVNVECPETLFCIRSGCWVHPSVLGMSTGQL
jgi:hypothetical protein